MKTTLINFQGMCAEDRERLLNTLFAIESGKEKLNCLVRYRHNVLSIVTEEVA